MMMAKENNDIITKTEEIMEVSPTVLSDQLDNRPSIDDTTSQVVEINGLNSNSGELGEDAVQRFLIKTYRRNCKSTEKFALNYISSEIQHPVISCFRELSKSDVNLIISKYKKLTSEVDQIISLIGLIDYIAVSINNPLYQDHFSEKNFKKTFPPCVDKLMLILKIFIVNFASKEKEPSSSQHEKLLNYLKNLVPLFNGDEYGKSYCLMLETIENEVTRARENQEKWKNTQAFLFGVEGLNGTRKENKRSSSRKKPETVKIEGASQSLKEGQKKNTKNSTPLLLKENENLSLLVRKRCSEDKIEVVAIKIPKVEEDKKPKNAFAILMNRSRELWKKNK